MPALIWRLLEEEKFLAKSPSRMLISLDSGIA